MWHRWIIISVSVFTQTWQPLSYCFIAQIQSFSFYFEPSFCTFSILVFFYLQSWKPPIFLLLHKSSLVTLFVQNEPILQTFACRFVVVLLPFVEKKTDAVNVSEAFFFFFPTPTRIIAAVCQRCQIKCLCLVSSLELVGDTDWQHDSNSFIHFNNQFNVSISFFFQFLRCVFFSQM